MVAVGNPDEIFGLATPAGICSIIQEGDKMHGKKIPKTMVRKSLSNYGIRGFLDSILEERRSPDIVNIVFFF